MKKIQSALLYLYIFRYKYGEGKACLLRTICEAAHTPLDDKSGVLAEIMSAVLRYSSLYTSRYFLLIVTYLFFRPSRTNEPFDHHLNADYVAAEELGRSRGNCHNLYPECDISILDTFSKYVFE